MTEVAERFYIDQLRIAPGRLTGVAVTRHGYGRPTRQIEVLEAGHPVPDAAGLVAARQRFHERGESGVQCRGHELGSTACGRASRSRESPGAAA